MKNVIFLILTLFPAYFVVAASGKNKTNKDYEIIDRVATWQVNNQQHVKHKDLDWTNGVLFKGIAQWAKYTGDNKYYDFLLEIGNKHNWGLLDRIYHADDLVVGQMYLDMYDKYKDESMIKTLKERVDFIVENPSQAQLWLGAENWSQRWSWCDALFMAPPVYTSLYKLYPEQKYLDFMDSEYKEAVDSLYDNTAHLFYRDRRYIQKREKNGEKVFWGRGNGWVFAGFPLILNTLPKNHPTYGFYMQLYKDMASAVIESQDKNGSWHASMLDPEAYPSPENSASGFFVYGLAWGVNNGILTDKKYKKAAEKGWKALKSYVNEDGKLGYVQPVSAAPEKVTMDMTEVYGVGAFLLAGIEMLNIK